MIWYIVKKDLKRMIRDRKALIITLLMPAILTAILGFSVGKLMTNEFTNLEPAKVGIVNNSQVDQDIEDMQQFMSSGLLSSVITAKQQNQILTELKTLDFQKIFEENVLLNDQVKTLINYEMVEEEEARQKIKNSELTSVIIFPEKFNFNMWINLFFPFQNRSEIELIQNTKEEIKADIVKNIVEGYTNKLSAGVIGKNTFTEVGIEAGIEQEKLFKGAGELSGKFMESANAMITFKAIPIEGKNKVDGFQYYAAAMAAMFILFTAVYSANYSLQEKHFITFERMKIAGVSLFQILSGRFLATMLFTILQLIILITFSSLAFQVYWGSLMLNFVLIFIVSIAIGGLAVLLSMINFKTEDERVANLFQGVIIPIFSLMGGSFISTSSMPSVVQKLGDLTPNGIALEGFLKIMQGYELASLGIVFLTLMIFTLVCVGFTIGIAKVKEV